MEFIHNDFKIENLFIKYIICKGQRRTLFMNISMDVGKDWTAFNIHIYFNEIGMDYIILYIKK